VYISLVLYREFSKTLPVIFYQLPFKIIV
jgi:hypothetical protein